MITYTLSLQRENLKVEEENELLKTRQVLIIIFLKTISLKEGILFIFYVLFLSVVRLV